MYWKRTKWKTHWTTIIYNFWILADSLSWIIIIPPLIIKNLIFPYFSTHFINHVQEHRKLNCFFSPRDSCGQSTRSGEHRLPRAWPGRGHARTCKQWDYEIWDGPSLQRMLRGILMPHAQTTTYATVCECMWVRVKISFETTLSPGATIVRTRPFNVCFYLWGWEKRPGFYFKLRQSISMSLNPTTCLKMKQQASTISFRGE